MNSTTTERFWQCYAALPAEVRSQAKEAYALFLRIEEVPGVNCQEQTKEKLLETLKVTLREALDPI